jgi:hypothetical protein
VALHVEAPSRARIDARRNEAEPWVEVCWTPCDGMTSPYLAYRIAGDGVVPSAPFSLPLAKDGRVSLRVAPKSSDKRAGGFALLGGGGALALAGVAVIAASPRSSGATSNDSVTSNQRFDAMSGGTLLILAGVTTALAGGAWVYDNGPSTATIGQGTPPAAPTTQASAAIAPRGIGLALPVVNLRF